MERIQEQIKGDKRFMKTVGYGAVGLALLAGSYITLSNNGRTHLKPEDFEKAAWIEFYNENGRIWSCYTNENISQHTSNWQTYVDEVGKKNKGKLEGDIFLPDLDGDGEVGK